MTVKTHLDEIIEYKETIKDMVAKSQIVLALLSNDENIEVDSNEASDVMDQSFFDYNYIDNTQTSVVPLIMVDVEIPSVPTGTIKDMYVFVQVAVPKTQMILDTIKFAVKGNRKDNLLRQIDLLLNNSQEFGIGKLKLESVNVASAPDKYTSTLLTYSIYDFARNRSVGNR